MKTNQNRAQPGTKIAIAVEMEMKIETETESERETKQRNESIQSTQKHQRMANRKTKVCHLPNGQEFIN